MVSIGDVVDFLDEHIPPSDAVPDDPIGLQVGDRNVSSSAIKVLVTLDLDPHVLQEAKDKCCSMVFAHHPLIFSPLKSVTPGNPYSPSSLAFGLVQSNIAFMAAHTNLDKSKYGTNAAFVRGMLPDCSFKDGLVIDDAGLVRKYECSIPAGRFADTAADVIGGHTVRMTCPGPDTMVNSFAVCTGSACKSHPYPTLPYPVSLMGDAIKAGVDMFITGDVGYHEAQAARAAGLNVLDIGHYAESLFVWPFVNEMNAFAVQRGLAVEFVASQAMAPMWGETRGTAL